MTRWKFFLLLIFTCCSAYAQAPDTSVVLYGKGTRGPYSLGFPNIIENSIRLSRGNILVSPDSFTVNRSDGLVFLASALSPGDSLIAHFKFLPISVKSQYYLYRQGDYKADTISDRMEEPTYQQSYGSDLKITGSKGFSIQSGEGVSNGLAQSLNLSITGELIPGLQTSAHISDKSTGRSGVSRRLDELDKIYIQAESRNFKGIFGDFDFVHGTDPLLSFQRKLTGLDARYSKAGNEIRGSAAFFPGEYASITINGSDGRLGPYYLTDKGGRQGAQILPGSEKVYLDGILQRRGSQSDYEIDYAAGTIQFTPSKVIRAESRITIDYEISREEYSRAFYATSGDIYPLTRFRVYSSIIQEGDSKNSPKSFELGAEERAILDSAGSDRLAARKSGIRLVGEGQGDYNLDSSGTYFKYIGPNLGQYDITFSFVGQNAGSYISRGGGVYEYVGTGLGDYDPVILIPLPETKRYGSLGIDWTSMDRSLNLAGEFVGSINDRNTFSNSDNSDPVASAVGEMKFQRKMFDNGFWGLGSRVRRIGERAIFPGRIDDVERYRDYDIDPGLTSAGEQLQEYSVTGGIDFRRSISLGFGSLRHSGLTERQRQSSELRWRLIGPLDLMSTLTRTHGDRTWWKHSDRLSASFARLQPNLRFNYEKRDGVSGFKYYEYVADVPGSYANNINGATSLSLRDEKYLDTFWRDKFLSGSVQQSLNYIVGKSGFSGDITGAYYRKHYKDYPGTDSEQKTGSTRLSFTDPAGRGAFSINERLGSSNERLQAKNYIYVGEGKGEYRLEDGEYISDLQGDYIAVIEELGEGSKISEVATDLNGTISPLNLIANGKELEDKYGRLSLETTLSYQLKRSADNLIGRDLFPWKASNLDKITLQNGELNARVYYYPTRGGHRFKYSLTRIFETGAPYANEITDNSTNTDEFSWAFPASKKIDLFLDFLTSSETHSVNGGGYKFSRYKGDGSANYRFLPGWTLSSGGGYENVRQTDTGLKANLPSVEIGLARDFEKAGRVSAKFRYSRMNANRRDLYIPYQAAQGKGAGDNFEANISGRLTITRNGRFDLSYRYEDFAKRATRNNFRLEFTLLFL